MPYRWRLEICKIVCGILFSVLACGTSAADKKATPPGPKDLAGVWIGFDSDELTFTRLELRPDFTGFLARVAPADSILHDGGVHVYRVTSWAVNGWAVTMQTVPALNASKIGYINGRIGLASLRLTIGGPENRGWKEQLLLLPETRLTVSNQETKRKIDEISGQ